MSSIELLLNRQSNPFLSSPAPSGLPLDNILQAGMKAPDHGALTPWQFIIAQDDGLEKLSQCFVKVVSQQTDDEIKLAKTKKMPFRAPMIIVIATQYKDHAKVPKAEQLITAGCAAHAMQMAAFAQGFGAMWRTGELAYNSDVKAMLNIDEQDDIVGFLYIGTPTKDLPAKPIKFASEVTRYL